MLQTWPTSHELEMRFGESFIEFVGSIYAKYQDQTFSYTTLVDEIEKTSFTDVLQDKDGIYTLKLLNGNLTVHSPLGTEIFQRFIGGTPSEIRGVDGKVINPGVGLPSSPFSIPNFLDASGNKVQFVLLFEINIPK